MIYFIDKNNTASPFRKARAFVGPHYTRFEDGSTIQSENLTTEEIKAKAPLIYGGLQITKRTMQQITKQHLSVVK